MLRQLRLVLVAVCLVWLEAGATPSTSPRLGIADIRVTESRDRTTIVALDGQGLPVGRLVLIHGRFMPTEDYGPEYRSRPIDGRRLTVEVKGQRFGWETLGFTDTLHMPALPNGLSSVAAFLADARVRPVLERWRIGWVTTARARRVQGIDVDVVGTNATACAPSSSGPNPLVCPIRAGSTLACAGGPAAQAFVVTQDDSPEFAYDQDVVSMCCNPNPSNPITGNGFFAVKTCAIARTPTPLGLDYVSECGNSGTVAKCQTCSLTPFSIGCQLSAHDTGRHDSFGAPIVRIDHCGDGAAPPAVTLAPPGEMWPPDHEMRAFKLADFASAVDSCGVPLDLDAAGRILSISSNEPGPDQFTITGPSTFSVRAERDGTGTGRIYQITFSVTDAYGNASPEVYQVRVPHDQSANRRSSTHPNPAGKPFAAK